MMHTSVGEFVGNSWGFATELLTVTAPVFVAVLTGRASKRRQHRAQQQGRVHDRHREQVKADLDGSDERTYELAHDDDLAPMARDMWAEIKSLNARIASQGDELQTHQIELEGLRAELSAWSRWYRWLVDGWDTHRQRAHAPDGPELKEMP